MGLVIGMDEAGYGPNLGPLVVTVTAWEVPDVPREADFWETLGDVVQQTRPVGGERLHVADSKQVYSPATGLANLERSVLCLLGLTGSVPTTYRQLHRLLTHEGDGRDPVEPWFENGSDLALPHAIAADSHLGILNRCRDCCERQGIRLKAVRSDIVQVERFNRLTAAADSKGVALSQISLQLLREVWDPDDGQPALIVADKHGGRNRYDGLLDDVLQGPMIFRRQEGKDLSCYRVGTAEIRFQTKAESHFPVAVASMVSKYVRELAMLLFNRFWTERIPDLKPTKGYPVDARRFKEEIAAVQQELDISDDVLWRMR